MKKHLLVILICALAVQSFAQVQESKDKPAPLIDMKDFFRNGKKSTFRISPDGKYYSYECVCAKGW